MQVKHEVRGAAEDPVSEQLGKFATEFEAKILRPVREKRAAGDEVLAIQPVALGVVRDPHWEGVVDGEICGLGPLAESVRTLLHWVPIKLDSREALRLCASCGDALAREGEFACAREFYNFVFKSCEVLEGDGEDPIPSGGAASPCLTLDEACWIARAKFGVASMELRLVVARDPHVQFSATLAKVVVHLRGIQNGMRLLLHLPKEKHDAVSWLVLEGSVLLFDWCEPLSVLGHGGVVAEFLAWSTLAMESMVSLSTVKHLPWRTRLAVATCYAFEDAGKPEASTKCANHALEKARELRRQEGMDPPIPAIVLRTLDAAEGDLKLLCFKYAAIAAAVAQRPQPTPGETGEGDGGRGGHSRTEAAEGAEGGGEAEGGLSDDDLLGLLEQHIPEAGDRPAALLELLGRAPGGPSSPAADIGSLTAREASAVCKCAVSLLTPTPANEAGGGEEGGEGGGENTEQGDIGDGGGAFPLDVNQEMQLMREIYRLGEFQAWEAMLPSTKKRLRDAGQAESLDQEDIRAFWFEIALWSSCRRLRTWRDKPESPQPASRGGLKKSPQRGNGETHSTPSLSSTATASNAELPRSSDPAAGVGDVNAAEDSVTVKPSCEIGEERGRGALPGKTKSVPGTDVEDDLREFLLATRQAEVVEIQLEGPGSAGVRVNLSPLLTVVGLLRKALFGPYRHVLERRREALFDAAVSLWEPYVASILKALDGMPAEAEVELTLLDALLSSLETVSACLSALNADDESLRATVALRLAILQADFRGDRRKACQTLRGALASIDKYRQSLISQHLHHAAGIDDANNNCSGDRECRQSQARVCLALGRASVTASFHIHQDSPISSSCGGNAGVDLGQGEVVADMGFHELAALQLEITSTLFRIELLMGRDVASQLGKHQKAEAAAQLAARKNASKRRKPSKKSSKVTFGDSEGRHDYLSGSLANGWSVTPPADFRGSGDSATKALSGMNAIVCAAGSGPLPTKATAAVEVARQNDITLNLTGSAAVGRVGSMERDAQVESCPATEGRLTSEFRRNPYGRAMLLMTMARLRSDKGEQERLLTEAAALLRQAIATENTLLGMLCPTYLTDDSSVPGPSTAGGGKSAFFNHPSDDAGNTKRNASSGRAEESKDGLAVAAGGVVAQIAMSASNATSTIPRHGSSKPTRKKPNVAKVCIYGKPEGAGTGVTLSNTHFAGLGVPIPFDESTGVCGAVVVRGLTPNESYVFAAAAFDEHDDPIGEGVGDACKPVETLNPLPLPLCWAQLSRTALGLGHAPLAAQAATEVYQDLMISGVVIATASGGRPQPRTVGRTTGERQGARGVTTDLRDGWTASPLLGQAFRPDALDRCPRGILQAFVQACFVLVETSDAEAMTKANACGGCPLEEQITIKGHEIGEDKAARAALLDHGPARESAASSDAVVFKEPSRLEGTGEQGGEEAEGDETMGEEDTNRQQLAVLEVWTGLPGYGTTKVRVVEETSEALTKLRKALNVDEDPVAPSSEGGSPEQTTEAIAPVSTLQMVEKIMPTAHEDPAKGWELLQAPALMSHPDRSRLLCRVCWIALDRGMAEQVVSWLAPSMAGVDGAAASTGAGEGGRSYLLTESDLQPLAAKVLAREGAPAEMPYISPAPTQPKVVEKSEEGDGGDGVVDVVSSAGRSDDEGGEQHEQEQGDESLDHLALVASLAESDQLLRLAEVEHILGAAYLHLGFAAAAKDKNQRNARSLGSSPRQPGTETTVGITLPGTSRGAVTSKATVAEAAAAAAAAGGRMTWGFGAGPFAEVFATKSEIFSGEGDRGGGHGDGDLDDVGDDAIIVQLEDDGAPWPSIDQIVSLAATVNRTNNVTTSTEEGNESDGDGAREGELAVLFSKAMLHLARAASRARWGRSWVKTERSCGLLWNAILSLWLSPQNFRPLEIGEGVDGGRSRCGWDLPLAEHHGRAYAKACEALLDAVDATHETGGGGAGRGDDVGGCGRSDGGSNPDKADDMSGQHQQGTELKAHVKHGENTEGSGDKPAPPDTRWVTRFVEWGLQGILRCRCWGVAVKIGSKLLASRSGLEGGHRVYPLVLFAQKRLCSLASTLLSRREVRLVEMDEQFQAAQAKRRRRKVLKALETKSKEEIEHERAREPLVEAVGDARVRKQIHDHRLGTLLQSRDTYAKTKKIGRRAIDEARESLAEHLALLSPPAPRAMTTVKRPSASLGLPGDHDNGSTTASEEGDIVAVGADESAGTEERAKLEDIEQSHQTVLRLYGRTVEVLRDKRERELLAEALCDVGDLHALTGCYGAAYKSWTDAIDSLCSALDSTKHWRKIFKDLRAAHPSTGGPPGGGGSLALALGGWSCLAGGIVLAKLSAFTGERECDYVSLTPDTLGGPGLDGPGLWADDRRLSAATFSQSLFHVQGALVAAARFKEAFAVQAILEHVALKVTLDPLQLVRAKLARVECLAEAGFPAEAAAALAGVLSGKSTPKTTGGYACRRDTSSSAKNSADAPVAESPDPGKGKEKKRSGGKGKAGSKAPAVEEIAASSGVGEGEGADDPRDLADSGLPFYGFAPYHNSLPLGHPDNTAAISWMIGDSTATAGEPTGEAVEGDSTSGKTGLTSRHGRLLKRGLYGMNPMLEELYGENEACLVARARARLLLTLADCSALLPSERIEEGIDSEGDGEGDAAEVLRRVRDAADCILGEVLQVVLKRISPAAIPAPAPPPDTGRSGKSSVTHASAISTSDNSMDSCTKAAAAVAAETEFIAATTPDKVDGWAPPMAAEALLMRGRLALLDGKLRVCRHHASRGLAVLLRHGLGANSGDFGNATALVRGINPGRGSVLNNGRRGSNTCFTKGTSSGSEGRTRVTFWDEQRQPWRVVQTWLDLRHDLAVVALLQGRTKDAIFQIEKGLEEACVVGEVVISNRLRRLRAQAAVAEGELEQAVSDCRSLVAVYLKDDSASTLDLAAVLRLLAKVRRQQSLVSGGSERRLTLELLSESLEALRLADRALQAAAEGLGWIGSGMLTYARRDDNTMGEDAKPCLLHALSTSYGDLRHHLPGDITFGFAPADEGDEVVQSPLANLYLPPLRLLLIVRVSMLDTLEGIGTGNAELPELEFCRALAGGGWGERGSSNSDENRDEDDLGATAERKKEGDWLVEASSIAEETVALQRHVAYPHPALRAHLLLLVGKLRLRRLQSMAHPTLSSSSSRNTTMAATAVAAAADGTFGDGTPSHGSVLAIKEAPKTALLRRRLKSAVAAALTAALRVSFARGGHDCGVMSGACMSLVVLYSSTAANSSGGGNSSGAEENQISARGGSGEHADGCSEEERDLGLASHFLRLAASISSGHKRLDVELDTIASDPLPATVIENLPRSALDELAGRGGRGPDDDPLRLTTRGLLQLLRARARERSLAAAPADLLPASTVCQIHALLYRHVPVYREKCCISKASLRKPEPEQDAPGNSLSPGTVCVQWIWAEIGSSDDMAFVPDKREGDELDGLHPTRTAFILLGSPPVVDVEDGDGGRLS
eukprot:g11581.t1